MADDQLPKVPRKYTFDNDEEARQTAAMAMQGSAQALLEAAEAALNDTVTKEDLKLVKDDVVKNKTIITTNTNNIKSLTTDNTTNKSDIAAMKTDISTLKSDVTTAKSNISSLQTDTTGLKNSITTINNSLTGILQRITALEGRALPAVKYVNGVKRTGQQIEFVGSALTVANGTATIYATTDGTANGQAIFKTIDHVNADALFNTGNAVDVKIAEVKSISSDLKTIVINVVNGSMITLLGLTPTMYLSAAGIRVYVTIEGE